MGGGWRGGEQELNWKLTCSPLIERANLKDLLALIRVPASPLQLLDRRGATPHRDSSSFYIFLILPM